MEVLFGGYQFLGWTDVVFIARAGYRFTTPAKTRVRNIISLLDARGFLTTKGRYRLHERAQIAFEAVHLLVYLLLLLLLLLFCFELRPDVS